LTQDEVVTDLTQDEVVSDLMQDEYPRIEVFKILKKKD
jgi:hypothetical protein